MGNTGHLTRSGIWMGPKTGRALKGTWLVIWIAGEHRAASARSGKEEYLILVCITKNFPFKRNVLSGPYSEILKRVTCISVLLWSAHIESRGENY